MFSLVLTTVKNRAEAKRLSEKLVSEKLAACVSALSRISSTYRWRGKRRRVAEYYDRLTAKRIADISSGCIVTIGYPKGIKYENYRGNGKRKLRRLMAGWAYGRVIRYIAEECAEKGIKAVESNEWRSSMTCYRCGSRNTERLTQSVIHCYNCWLTYNADFNAAINIGSSILAEPRSRGVQLNHPELRMNQPERLGSAEAAGL